MNCCLQSSATSWVSAFPRTCEVCVHERARTHWKPPKAEVSGPSSTEENQGTPGSHKFKITISYNCPRNVVCVKRLEKKKKSNMDAAVQNEEICFICVKSMKAMTFFIGEKSTFRVYITFKWWREQKNQTTVCCSAAHGSYKLCQLNVHFHRLPHTGHNQLQLIWSMEC